MARRRNRSGEPRGKSPREARAERITWGLMVVAFAVTQFLDSAVPPITAPLVGAVILLGSGISQSLRGWRVSIVTWVAGIAMMAFTMYNWLVDPTADFLAETLIAFAAVILWGVISGET